MKYEYGRWMWNVMEWKWNRTCEMKWKWREMEWKWSEMEWNCRMKWILEFLSNGTSDFPEIFWGCHQYYYASSTEKSQPLVARISRKMRNGCRWKWPISWKIHTEIFWNFLCLFTLPQCIYHKNFRTNGCTVWKLWQNQFLPCFTLHFAQCCNKKVRHGLILRPNWVIPMGNCVFLPSLLPHASRISFWWRKGAAVQKHSNLSYSVHNAENWKSAWKTLLKCP